MDNDWLSNPVKAVSSSSNSCVNRRTTKRCSPLNNDCKWDEVSASERPMPLKILAGPLVISARWLPPILLWKIRAKAPITENVPIVFWKKIRWSGVLRHKWCHLFFSFSCLAIRWFGALQTEAQLHNFLSLSGSHVILVLDSYCRSFFQIRVYDKWLTSVVTETLHKRWYPCLPYW